MCESTTAYRKETSSIEVEEVESLPSLVHRNGGETYLRLRQLRRFHPRSRLLLTVVHKPHLSVPCRAEAFTTGPVYTSHRVCSCGPHNAQSYRHPQMCQPRRLMLRTCLECGSKKTPLQPVPSRPMLSTPLAACLKCGGDSLQPLLSHPLLSYPRLPGCLEYGSKTRL